MGVGPEEDYIVYGHKVPSEEPKELVLCMHADLSTLTSPVENIWMSCSHHSSSFFLRSKEGRERDYSISLVLFLSIQRRPLSSFKM